MSNQNEEEWVSEDPSEERLKEILSSKVIAIDLETKDTGLMEKGPGWATNDGYVTGVAISTDTFKKYYPLNHAIDEQTGGGNLENKEQVIAWLKQIAESSNDKVFHNASYDVGWLRTLGINVKGKIHDTMVSSALINENRLSFSLDACTKAIGEPGKNDGDLWKFVKSDGNANKGIKDPKKDMYKIPAKYVAIYAETDTELTYKLHMHNLKEIKKQELSEIYDIETRLIPCLVDMRAQGVRVDLEGAEKAKRFLIEEEKKLLMSIKKEAGMHVEIWAAASIAKAFDKLKIKYPRTSKTKAPSFTKQFLTRNEHPLSKLIVEAREFSKTSSTFIDGILNYEHKGRIHAEIHQMKSGEDAKSGTVTGRFSYSNPNLQQIPARNPALKNLVRSLFIPDEGKKWGMIDYSQQEPRLVVHFAEACNIANGTNFKSKRRTYDTQAFVMGYRTGDADFHEMVAEIADVERKIAKTINLGLFYGMGKKKLAEQLNLDFTEASAIINEYNKKVPFIKDLSNEAMEILEERDYVTTVLGRRCRSFGFVPKVWGHKGKDGESYWKTEEEAKKNCPDYNGDETYKKAYAYKALNKLIQGSAADQTKKAMVDLYEQDGIIPHIQVHDELNISVENKEQALNIKTKMENAVELLVPSVVDYKLTKNWGESK